MSLKVTEFNDVKVYNLAATKSALQFEKEAAQKKTSLKYNEEYRRRVELLQDFEFNTHPTQVKVTPDRGFIGAVGMYPPELRVFDTHQLAMKFLRRTDAEIVDFLFLGEDWRKLVLLCADRTVEFHAQYGKHHKVRVPKFGRSLAYDAARCTLFVGGSGSEIFRIDLEEGIFMEPLKSNLTGVNQLALSPSLPLLACAGEDGVVEIWDLRDLEAPIEELAVFCDGDDETNGRDCTCLAFSRDGMRLAVGLASGVVRVYDIRSRKPLCERDHYNGLPIKSVEFHCPSDGETKELVVSADQKAVKLWGSASAGDLFTSLEAENAIASVTIWPESGLLFVAAETERVGCFFIPSLGIAPKWCSYLDSITEELEENPTSTVFDQYQFVTSELLHQLDAGHLIGSNMLQPYMHGFMMDVRLYHKLRAVSEPFAFEEFRKKKIEEKLSAKRGMRTKVKRKVGTNEELRAKLEEAMQVGAKATSTKKKSAAEKASSLLSDDRFAKMFENPDFEMEKVDRSSAPSAKKRR